MHDTFALFERRTNSHGLLTVQSVIYSLPKRRIRGVILYGGHTRAQSGLDTIGTCVRLALVMATRDETMSAPERAEGGTG